MHRDARSLTNRIQTLNRNVATGSVLGQSLPVHACWNPAHHVMTGRNDRYRFFGWIRVCVRA